MPRQTQSREPKRIEADFIAALERLAGDRPRHPELRKRSQQGRLRISISTVAMEAGRARTLIATEKCRYPRVRAKVLEYTKPISNPNTAAATIASLRQHIRDLTSERDKAIEQALGHLRAREAAEREADKWRKAHQRLMQNADDGSRNIVPISTAGRK